MARKTLEQILAFNCREFRKSRKMTQEAVAERASLHLRHYQKIEDASVNVTLRTLQRLADAFKTKPQLLLW